MRIKTLNEIELQFEKLPVEEQINVTGGLGVRTLDGYIINIEDYYAPTNFVSDNDPETIGGGYFQLYQPGGYGSTTVTVGGLEDSRFTLIGYESMSGYESDGFPVYYDNLSGGYVAFSDRSNAVLDFEDNITSGFSDGDYVYHYDTTISTYFDEVTGGYFSTSQTDVNVIYTGYATMTAAMLAAELAARKAEEEQRLYESQQQAKEMLNFYNEADATRKAKLDAWFQSTADAESLLHQKNILGQEIADVMRQFWEASNYDLPDFKNMVNNYFASYG